LVEKWIPPSRSKIAKIGVKTKGILGVKQRIYSKLYPQGIQLNLYFGTCVMIYMHVLLIVRLSHLIK
jgi:hypothetical protein